MNTRMAKVEELLRREIAAALVRGELRDPRLGDVSAISVTGVQVAPDLSNARIYVDVMAKGADVYTVLRGLNAGAAVLHHALRERVELRRTPKLRFERDESIDRGRAIEAVLGEIAAERKIEAEADEPDDAPADEPDDDVDPGADVAAADDVEPHSRS
ncbi:MAG: 30S ribosome-binding factor RbfA [Deltaproteobacteria bacterium]|nr:30S ribosome-binding factor RbfA [Nannocystaceae bacterium]